MWKGEEEACREGYWAALELLVLTAGPSCGEQSGSCLAGAWSAVQEGLGAQRLLLVHESIWPSQSPLRPGSAGSSPRNTRWPKP